MGALRIAPSITVATLALLLAASLTASPCATTGHRPRSQLPDLSELEVVVELPQGTVMRIHPNARGEVALINVPVGTLRILNVTYQGVPLECSPREIQVRESTRLEVLIFSPWTVSIEVEADGLSNVYGGPLTLGQVRGATLGIDRGLDQVAPPEPPGPPYLAARIVRDGHFMLRDFIGPLDEPSWTVEVILSVNKSFHGKVALNWSINRLPLYPNVLILNDSGRIVDMLIHDGYSINVSLPCGGVVHRRLEVSTTLPSVRLRRGWNLVGIPVKAQVNVSEVFHDKCLAAYTWDPDGKRYILSNTLEPCKGYWLYLVDDVDLHFYASPIEEYAVRLHKGWNLVGPTANTLTTLRPRPLALYTYDAVTHSYIRAGGIPYGMAAWILVVDDCEVEALGAPLSDGLARSNPTSSLSPA